MGAPVMPPVEQLPAPPAQPPAPPAPLDDAKKQQASSKWPTALVVIGALLVLLAVALELLGVFGDLTSEVTKTGTDTTKTTTGGAKPDAAFITAMLSAGLASILGGAFYWRISTIKAAGVEIGMKDQEKEKAQIVATIAQETSDPETAAVAYTDAVATVASQRTVIATAEGPKTPPNWDETVKRIAKNSVAAASASMARF
ncbi:MAG: hypothetical protein JWN20_901 [Jatrophihabitantaceae bacterium]|nr:hypothetical protein [Jatrophihabitantaceae bacterium]